MFWTFLHLRKALSFSILYVILVLAGLSVLGQLKFNVNSGDYSPVVSIKTQYFGMDSRYIEKNITIPIERALSSVKGIEKISSVSEEGQSIVTVRIKPERPIKIATLEIKSIVDTVKQSFPKDVQEPVISHYDPSQMPIYILSFYPSKNSALTLMDIRRIVSKKLKPNIQKVDGVADVIVTGGKQKQIVVFGNARALYSSGLQLQDLNRYIQQNNENLFLGTWENNQADYPIYMKGRLQNIFDIDRISINTYQSNQSKYQTVKELARVQNHYKQIDSISRINGKERVSLYIQKRSRANVLKVCDQLNKMMSLFQENGIKWETDFDSSKEIRKSLNNLIISILIGIVLLFGVTIPFLGNIKLTLLMLVSIPISLSSAFLLAAIFDVEINAMILTGVALGVGLLVDNGLIVLEFLSRGCGKKNFKKHLIEVIRLLIAPLFSSLVTTLCVFIPILLSSVQIRYTYAGFILVVAVLLVFSFFLAIGLVPMLYYRYRDKLSMKKTVVSNGLLKIQYILVRWQKTMYRHRRMVLELFVVFMVISFTGVLIKGYEPASSYTFKEIYAYVEPPTGTSLEDTDIETKKVENVLIHEKDVKKLITKVEKAHSSLIIKLKKEKNKKEMESFVQKLKKDVSRKSETFVYFNYGGGGQGGDREINIEFIGDNIRILKKLSSQAAKRLYGVPEFSDVVFRYKDDEPVYAMRPDIEKIQLSGLNLKNIIDESRIFLYGVISTKMNTKNKGLIDVRITSDRELDRKKITLKDYLSISIRAKDGRLVPLSEFLRKERSGESSKIYRINKRRVLTISARLKSKYPLQYGFKKIQKEMNEVKMPAGYYWQFDDRYERIQKRNKSMMVALFVALFLTMITLVVVYENIKKAILTLVSIPFMLPGIAVAFYVFGFAFSTPVFIAMILLTGITVNTSVLLLNDVDKEMPVVKIMHKMKEKMSSILLTTLTTVSGLIPMIFTPGSGSYIWKPFSLTIIFGLVSSTILSILVTPILIRKAE